MSKTKSVPLKSYSSMKFFFRKIRIFFGIKEGLLECATVCIKSEVILIMANVPTVFDIIVDH